MVVVFVFWVGFEWGLCFYLGWCLSGWLCLHFGWLLSGCYVFILGWLGLVVAFVF